tara:strand:+ start:842 stop:1096 length:255 start_codon:yes stop_codon:yes gene_type:complete
MKQQPTELPETFKWLLKVYVDSADVDIEVNYECVTVEVNDFECYANVRVDEDLLDDCLDIDDLYTLKRLCETVIAKRLSDPDRT